MAFECPPDCGYCCTHLEREPEPGLDEFRAILREHGVYHCSDAPRVGLSLSNAEAAALREEGARRKLRLDLHPRTFLLGSRRRVAVVLDWHMPHASCPFYADFKCVAYDARPLTCRAYPVLGLGRGGLAPECPKMPVATTQLRAERKARRASDEAHARVDAHAWKALERGGFARGLSVREAEARLERSRIVSFEDHLAGRSVPARAARARSSTS